MPTPTADPEVALEPDEINRLWQHDTLSVWRETPFYTERERAALAWAEPVTRINEGVSGTFCRASS